jgi:hypothetical protein
MQALIPTGLAWLLSGPVVHLNARQAAGLLAKKGGAPQSDRESR